MLHIYNVNVYQIMLVRVLGSFRKFLQHLRHFSSFNILKPNDKKQNKQKYNKRRGKNLLFIQII